MDSYLPKVRYLSYGAARVTYYKEIPRHAAAKYIYIYSFFVGYHFSFLAPRPLKGHVVLYVCTYLG